MRRSPTGAIACTSPRSLAAAAAFPRPEKLTSFTERLPREWIEQALHATGTATLRRRRLPAEQVVWLVLGMALFRDRSIVRDRGQADLALPGPGESPVAPSAVPQARARLGDEPMEWLFAHSARQWAARERVRHRWRASPSTLSTEPRCGYPTATRTTPTSATRTGARHRARTRMVRIVALMAVRSHLLAGARHGPYYTGEQVLAAELWPEVAGPVPHDRRSQLPVAAGPLVPLARSGDPSVTGSFERRR